MWALNKPRDEGLIAGVAVLAQTFELVEDHLLRFLALGFWTCAHIPLTFRADGAYEAKEQFVLHRFRSGDRRGC